MKDTWIGFLGVVLTIVIVSSVTHSTMGDIREEIGRVNGRLDGIEKRMTGLETRMTRMEGRMTGIETRMTRMETRMTGIENRMTGIENRMTGIENRMVKVESRIGKLENRTARVEKWVGLTARGLNLIPQRRGNPRKSRSLKAEYHLVCSGRISCGPLRMALRYVLRQAKDYSG